MFGFFKRKPKPTPHYGPRSTAIVVGDLVVCIDGDWTMEKHPVPAGKHPVKGEVYRVAAIKMTNRAGFHPGPWLYLTLRPDVGYTPEHFRKAQLNHEPAEECFTASIRDLVKEPVS